MVKYNSVLSKNSKFQEADLMSRVITDVEGQEAFASWLRSFLPQLFDEDFVLEPGTLNILDETQHVTILWRDLELP